MSWIGWAVIAIIAADALFFGALALNHILEERRRRK